MSKSNFVIKNIVISAAADGIGWCIASFFIEQGHTVFLSDINQQKINEIKKHPLFNKRIFIENINASDPGSVKKYFESLTNKLSSIDALINNVGIAGPTGVMEDLSIDDWKQTIDINLTAPFHLSQLVAESMKKNNWGRIINIASLQSLRAFDNSIPYGASKGGIMQLTRALAQAYSKDGILVNAIAPGFFRTNLTESLFQDPDKLKTLADKTMMGRNGEEKDIFGISVFLCSEANSYVTGQTIFLDGGFSAA